MSTPILPQELIDNVVDHLHDDTSALKACALVCRAWLPSCYFHIFHSIALQPPEAAPRYLPKYLFKRKDTDCQRLYQTVQSRPEIASCIRTLLICEGIVGREWVTQEATLPLLMRMLKNTRRFELERSASMSIKWGDMSQEVQGAIGGVLALPSLLEVKLVGLVFDRPADLLYMLQGCQSLRVLQADKLVFLNDSDVDSAPGFAPGPHRAPLDVLIVGPRTSTTLITCLLHPDSTINATALRRLSVSISSNYADFARLLRSTPSLEVLELILMNDIDLQAYWTLPPADHLDISHNPHLHTLDIKIDVIQRQDDPLPWLHALFATVRTPNALRQINIVYSLYLPSPYMDRSVNTTIFHRWREIDATLTGPEFTGLRRVRLEFALENPIGFGVAPRFLKEVNLQSPALEASGMLVVDAFDTSQ